MIYVDTASSDACYNFGCEVYFARHPLPDDVFLLWRTEPTLMIGKYQNALEEIDAAYAREHGITVVRRLSGGGTIYPDRGGWQFTFITRSLGAEIEFARFVDPIVEVLRSLGLDAAATGRNDITVGGRKVSGNAQFRLGDATVHHGSLLFDTDLTELARAATPKPYKITSKAIRSVRDRVTNIRDALREAGLPDLTAEAFHDLLVSRLSDSVRTLTEDEKAAIDAIAREQFADPALLWKAVPRFELEKVIHTSGGTFEIGLTVRHGVIESALIRGDFFSSSSDPAGENPGALLTGVPYDPASVTDALRPFADTLFSADAGEIAAGLFE